MSYNPNFTKLDHQVSNTAAFFHPKLERTTLLNIPSKNGGREHDRNADVTCGHYILRADSCTPMNHGFVNS